MRLCRLHRLANATPRRLEMSAAIDQCQTIPQRKCCSFPKSDARTLARHPPLAIGSVQKYLRIESLRPIHHRRVIMRMRDRDGADTAARVELGSGLAVEKRDAIPEQISSVRLQNKALWPIEQICRSSSQAAVGWMIKSNETVTIFSCHFARKSKSEFDNFRSHH